MTKFGVHAFSEALRQEALHQGIRVTIVAPGFVDTELQGHNTNPLVRQATARAREQIGEVLQAGGHRRGDRARGHAPAARVRERGRWCARPGRRARPRRRSSRTARFASVTAAARASWSPKPRTFTRTFTMRSRS